jgi:hypothetical protein
MREFSSTRKPITSKAKKRDSNVDQIRLGPQDQNFVRGPILTILGAQAGERRLGAGRQGVGVWRRFDCLDIARLLCMARTRPSKSMWEWARADGGEEQRCSSREARTEQIQGVCDRTRSTYALNANAGDFYPSATSSRRSAERTRHIGSRWLHGFVRPKHAFSALVLLVLIGKSAAFVSFPLSCFGISVEGGSSGFFFPRLPLLTYDKLSSSSNRCSDTRCTEAAMVGRSLCEEDVSTRKKFYSPLHNRTAWIPFTFFTEDGRAVKIMSGHQLTFEDEEEVEEPCKEMFIECLPRPFRVNSGEFGEFAEMVSADMHTFGIHDACKLFMHGYYDAPAIYACWRCYNWPSF